jgi:putative peptidoglycan lipid II flippase
MLYSYFFGAGPLLSSFRIAFMIPNLARRLFGEGALSAAFIPVFTRVLAHSERPEARRLAGAVLTLLVSVLACLIVLLECGLWVGNSVSPSIVWPLTAIMLPFMAFICVAAFLGGVLNSIGHFAAPAASPVLLNVFVILALLGFASTATDNDVALIFVTAWAVVAAGIAQVAMQWIALRRRHMEPILSLNWKRPEIRDILRMMAPMLLGLSTVQINTLMDLLIATWFVPDGKGPAVLGYAHFLYQLPLGVFGIALATAIFPVLSAQAARNDMTAMSQTLTTGFRLSFFIAMPATAGLILIANPLVTALLLHGEFTRDSADRVARALCLYTLGLTAYSAQHILVRAYYSLKDSATPARIAAGVVVVNLILNLILVRPLQEAGVGLATAITSCLQVTLLVRGLRRKVTMFDAAAFTKSVLRTTGITMVMAIVVWLSLRLIPVPDTRWGAATLLVVAVPIGCVTVAVFSRVIGATELSELLHRRGGSAIRADLD